MNANRILISSAILMQSSFLAFPADDFDPKTEKTLIEMMKDKQAAAAIDIGDTKTGKEANTIDRYDCPRCGGAMVRVSYQAAT